MDPGRLRLGIGGTNIEAVAWKLSEYPDGTTAGTNKRLAGHIVRLALIPGRLL